MNTKIKKAFFVHRSLLVLFCLLTFVSCMLFFGCGRGKKETPVTATPPPYEEPVYTPDKLTEEQKQQLQTHVNTAKNNLYKSQITKANFEAAKDAVDKALALSPNSPDANLLSALIDIGVEVERIMTQVLHTPQSLFPLDASYNTTAKLLQRATLPVAKPLLSPIAEGDSLAKFREKSEIKKRFTSDDPKPSEIQQEVETNVLPVLSRIIKKLEKVLAYVIHHPTWTFSYPKDSANLALGYNYIDKSDVRALVGALYLIRGLTYFGISYHLDDTGKAPGDINNDNLLTPSEYFPPNPFLTLRPNGATYLSNAQKDFAAALYLLKVAVDELVAEEKQGTPDAAYHTLTTQQLKDIKHYKHYIDKLAASFNGVATNITIPENKGCVWRETYYYGTSLRSDRIFDPSYNRDKLTKCEYTFTVSPETTINVKFSGLFVPAITDWRNVAPTFKQDEETVVHSFPDITINGIFPGGIQRSWFDETDFDYWFKFSLYDQNGRPIPSYTITSATLTIAGKTFSKRHWWGNKVVFSYDWGRFPTKDDLFTINDLYGTPATLTVSGYKPVSFTVTDRWDQFDITLTPSSS